MNGNINTLEEAMARIAELEAQNKILILRAQSHIQETEVQDDDPQPENPRAKRAGITLPNYQ